MDEIWSLETALWLKGIEQFEAVLGPTCLLALPGIGVLDRDQTIASLKDAPRWSKVTMREQRTAGDGSALVLAYQAEGEREGGAPPYHALCSSTYVRHDGAWRMVQHQQT